MIMKKLFLFFLFSGIVAVTSAQTKNGTINGIINSDEGKPLEAATVLLLKEKDSSIAKTATTDKLGLFSFAKIAEGRYFISITSQGYQNFKSTAFVLDSISHAITLPPVSLLPSVKNLNAV